MTDSILLRFIGWYYGLMPVSIFRTGRNFLLWGWQFFSIGFLLPRIFSPWHKDITSYGLGFDFGRWFQAFVWNLVSRGLGAVLRVVVICSGIVVEIFLAGATLAFLVLWCLLPIIIPLLFFSGFANLAQL